MIRRIGLAFVLLTTSLACKPAYGWQDYQLKRTLRNLEKMRSFQGTLVETGVVPGEEVKTEVVFQRPHRFAARIEAPAQWAGSTVLYDGDTLSYHYPQLRYAIRIRGLELPEGDRADEVVKYRYRRNLARFDFSIRGSSRVAGHPTITMWHNAKQKGAYSVRGWNKVYDAFSFPLAGEYELKGGAEYGYRYANIAFNDAIPKGAFELEIPEGTIVAEWNLESPAVKDDALETAGFELVLPDDNPLGLKRTRLVRAGGPFNALGARYQRGPHFVLVLAHPSMGLSVPEYGVPVKAGASGRLILGPSTSSYAFVRDGTYYTLLGNAPFEEILQLAEIIHARAEPPD